MAITFDEKLEAAWGLHKIEKAVLEKEIERLRAENEKLCEALSDAAGELRHAYIMGFTERYRDAAIAARSVAAAIRESGKDHGLD